MVVESENPNRLAWVLPYQGGYSDDLKTLRARPDRRRRVPFQWHADPSQRDR